MSARDLEVQLTDDHIRRLASCRPVEAIVELVWNAFDSGATEIDVRLIENGLGGVQSVEITDNGDGINYESIDLTFGDLGRSLKARQKTNSRGIPMHGCRGEGRFRAYSLGQRVQWETVTITGQRYTIRGEHAKAKKFEISEPVLEDALSKGTSFVAENIFNVPIAIPSREALADRLSSTFAHRLLGDPKVKLSLNGDAIDPQKLIAHKDTTVIQSPHGEILTNVVIWKSGKKKELYWCDASENARDHEDVKLASDFPFSIYVSTKAIDDAIEANMLGIKDMAGLSDLRRIAVNHARGVLSEYTDDRGSKIIEGLKDKGVYPYSIPPVGEVQLITRGVFDACAAKIFSSVKAVSSAPKDTQWLTLRLLRNAIERSPEEMGKILRELFGATDEQISDLYKLLERTTLSGLISTGKLVGDRLDFLSGLRQIVLSDEYRKVVKERSELHKIIEKECWVFGEGFSLGTSDETLDSVLSYHRSILHHGEDTIDIEVDSERYAKTIPDLVLGSQYKLEDERLLHLVVELKRPSVSISFDQKTQIERYASEVSSDANFDKDRTSWVFYVISSKIDKRISDDYLGKGPSDKGQLPTSSSNMKIFVKTWGQLLQDAHTRMAFLKDKLDMRSTRDDGIEYLSKKFPAIMEKIEDRKDTAKQIVHKKSGIIMDGLMPNEAIKNAGDRSHI
ncbi:ATP-binding protein [Azospirillum argentinense]|uniref:ATP-binding protein n=1 Tax=Azospirillum argentinense TaxID=2970906 RepID=UPI00190EEEB0|nr:ATP-binding protein [Azospirillum argentinense]